MFYDYTNLYMRDKQIKVQSNDRYYKLTIKTNKNLNFIRCVDSTFEKKK